MKRMILSGFFLWVCWVIAPAIERGDQTDTLKHKEFIGTALYGYMNGGSDLYYEYGFEKLRVTELRYTFTPTEGGPITEKYTIEEYTTAFPAGAFGLYSIHVNKFLQRDLYGWDCLTNYQLQGCIGNTYLSIVLENPTHPAREGAVQLYKQYLKRDSSGKYELPEPVRQRLLKPGEDAVSGCIQLIQGPIALNNSAQDLYPLFEAVEKFELWIAENTDAQGRSGYRALAIFSTTESAQKFREQNHQREIPGFLTVQVVDLDGFTVEILLTEGLL